MCCAFQEWWTNLWLNEGFASWIEYLCVDHCFPEYDIWTQFASSDFTHALNEDALTNSHPIEVSSALRTSNVFLYRVPFFFLIVILWLLYQVPVGHPDEVDEIFDAISYSKGAAVIRMLHDYIGDAV